AIEDTIQGKMVSDVYIQDITAEALKGHKSVEFIYKIMSGECALDFCWLSPNQPRQEFFRTFKYESCNKAGNTNIRNGNSRFASKHPKILAELVRS
ncbi:MAG: hypothetical protein AABY22_24340, partial [Nanoarchaeota archaeon]